MAATRIFADPSAWKTRWLQLRGDACRFSSEPADSGRAQSCTTSKTKHGGSLATLALNIGLPEFAQNTKAFQQY